MLFNINTDILLILLLLFFLSSLHFYHYYYYLPTSRLMCAVVEHFCFSNASGRCWHR